MHQIAVILRFGEFEIDQDAALLRRGGVTVHVEPRILQLLLYLAENRGRLVTKEELNREVWGGAFVTDNALDRAMARLRKTLGDDVHQPRFIETAPGMGYRFLAPVETASPAAGTGDAATPPSVPRRARVLPTAVVALAAAGLVAALIAVLAARSPDTVARSSDVTTPNVADLIADDIAPRQLTSSQDYEFGPAFSPDGSTVVYVSNRTGSMEAWIKPLATGGREVQLTSGGDVHRVNWSPDGRWIAYSTYRGIWLVPPTGGAPRQLAERGTGPAWSPDSSTLVFQLGGEGNDINSLPARPPATLWTVGLDGGPPRPLTQADQPSGGHGQPTFSPDGERIAFVTGAVAQPGELWTMSAAGGDLRRVAGPCGCRDPVYSPDGERLYYTDTVDSLPGLWQVRVDGGSEPRRLHQAPLRFLAISPDGRRLAASRHDLRSDLWSLPVSPATALPTGAPAPLTRETNYRNMYPVASPDGRRIAFLVIRAGSQSELWMMDAAGGNRTLITAINAAPRTPGSRPAGASGWPRWSASGEHLYYIDDDELRRIDLDTLRSEQVLRTDLPWQTTAIAPEGRAVAFSITDQDGVNDVWALDREGAQTRVTREPRGANFPTWSPDARRLAVEVYRADGTHCAVVDAGGGEATVLTGGADLGGREECYTGGWSPDGDKIALVRRPAGTPSERWDVWWASVSTGELLRLTERPPHPGREFVRYPTWSPSGDRIYFELAQSSADLWLFELPES